MLEKLLKELITIIKGFCYSLIDIIKKNFVFSAFCIILVSFIIINISTIKTQNRSNITAVVPNVKFAGMGVLINKNFILTTDYIISDVCLQQNAELNLIYMLYKGNYYVVKSLLSNKELNLNLLEIVDYKFKNETVKNYVLVSDKNNINIKDTVYFYKTINKPYNSVFKKTKVKEVYNYSFLLNNKKKSFENEGSPVLDSSLNLLGIISETSKSKNLMVLDINIINKFLETSKVNYFINTNNKVNLLQIENYTKDITVQIVCNPNIPVINLKSY